MKNTSTEEKVDWEKLIRRLEILMRLKSFPVAFKMLEKKEDLEHIPFMRKAESKVTLCQLITRVRSFDWTVGADGDSFLFPACPSMLGLKDKPETFKDGTFRNIVWVSTKEEGKKYEASIPSLPLGKYEAVVMAPLVYKPFEPDIVLIYANPAQMMLLINSLQFTDYEVMEFFCVGESSCADAIARCYLTGKPSMTIPCYGERRYGHAQDEDMVIAIPASMMQKALSGMEALYRRGVRYPISFSGAESVLEEAFPPAYAQLGTVMETLRGQDNRMLLGVTGGIASGKTTVANMLEEMGAPIVDFDLIARQVVEPDKVAWKKIIEYFGEQVLQPDRTIDRQKLSKIVFGDLEKRKKLEEFTHPPIYDEFFKQVNDIAAKDPEAIIQVVVPLLVELNLQYLFDKLLVVHISRELQVTRLAERNSIPEEEASNMLSAQLPIDEKVKFANFVIHNDGDLEHARTQAETVWKQLKDIQRKKKEVG